MPSATVTDLCRNCQSLVFCASADINTRPKPNSTPKFSKPTLPQLCQPLAELCQLFKYTLSSLHRAGYDQLTLRETAVKTSSLNWNDRGILTAGHFVSGKSDNGRDIYSQIQVRAAENCIEGVWKTNGNITLEDRIPFVKAQLAECETRHGKCSNPRTTIQLPTRLLYLGKGHDLQPKLITTSTLTRSDERYTTLSHRWGSSQPLRTLTSNIESLSQSIPLSSLPPTFLDAMRLTLSLDIHHIWIDSLCIIQDSPSDWSSEAARMSSVYSHSTLNIAAVSAADCHGGLFLSTPSPLLLTSASPATPLHPLVLRVAVDPWSPTRRTPLHKRGWIFQELLLAPRTLYCSSTLFYFSCATSSAAEDPYMASNASINDDEERHGTASLSNASSWKQYTLTPLMARWWAWLHRYTQLDFTFAADRLAALAGVAEAQREAMGLQPVLGLWGEAVAEGLRWAVMQTHGAEESGIPGVPSWTWLARRGAHVVDVHAYWGRQCETVVYDGQGEECAVVERVGVEYNVEGMMTSGIKGASLSMRGKLRVLNFVKLEDGNWGLEKVPMSGLAFDSCSYPHDKVSPVCLLVCRYAGIPKKESGKISIVLMLEEVKSWRQA